MYGRQFKRMGKIVFIDIRGQLLSPIFSFLNYRCFAKETHHKFWCIFEVSSDCTNCTLVEMGDKTIEDEALQCEKCGKYPRRPFQSSDVDP